MKNKNKKYMLITAILLLSIAFSFITLLPITHADEVITYLHQSASPNPVGVGQKIHATFMMLPVPPSQLPIETPRYGYWEGLTLTIEKPDGKIETIGPIASAEAGAGTIDYTPTIVGNYTLQWKFPGQNITIGPRAGDYYKPSESNKLTIVVQEQPVGSMPWLPLPSEYLNSPIYGDKHNWAHLAGNWLWGSNARPNNSFQEYGTAPNTAHIRWTEQVIFGGIMDESLGPNSAYTGRRGPYKMDPPIILGGRLYVNTHDGTSLTGFRAIDIYTGKTLWEQPGPPIQNGQIIYHISTSQSGVFAYLWNTQTSTWQMFDAWTGGWVLNITGVQSGTNVIGPQGEILRYATGGSSGARWLTLWNSSQACLTASRVIGVAADWDLRKGSYPYSSGLQWNITLPAVPGNPSISQIATDLDLIVMSNTLPATTQYPDGIRQELAYSIKPGEEGKLLWVQNRTTLSQLGGPEMYYNGVYWKHYQPSIQWFSYDATTGKLLGETEPMEGLAIYGGSGRAVLAYDYLYTTGYDGYVRAWAKNGTKVWEWYAGPSGLDTPYNSWPLHGSYTGPTAGDDKVFIINSEHTPLTEMLRGGRVYAINATTGKEIWSISGSQAEANPMGVGWSTLVYLNAYDGKIYCFGNGPSETTVSVPANAIEVGEYFTITGTVLDMSPGQEGVAAVSDENQAIWMEYLHMQQPKPTNATGVTVKLTAVDPNKNTISIGETTTDLNGVYGLTWTPEVPGLYQVIATFEGSGSYGSSTATTYLSAVQASVSATEPTLQPQTSLADQYLIPGIVAIIVAIAIVGALQTLLLLKKRP
ncbi:MAG: PQQ-binding-like beta-propeller repeat protein [Nitrososphaerota archaeon]|nr:PQQ-binding-like beta-propeller repeat protein [Nitrososphaerota archaeon]